MSDAPKEDGRGDPRVYMAAERTFLAWLRTGIALMAFGFVVARFAYLLTALGGGAPAAEPESAATDSLALGLALILGGIVVCAVSALRHRRYVQAIDEHRFRAAFGSAFAFSIAALLALVGAGMVLLLARL